MRSQGLCSLLTNHKSNYIIWYVCILVQNLSLFVTNLLYIGLAYKHFSLTSFPLALYGFVFLTAYKNKQWTSGIIENDNLQLVI